MHRFFIAPEWLKGDRVTIGGSLVHQIRNVLRLGPGDRIVVLDNSGWEREVEITRVERQRVTGRVVDKRLATGEPRTKITLYQGVLRLRRFEFALQKGTELGIVEFVPLITDRCIISSVEDVDKKMERWQRIVVEAAEQSRRGRLPRLQPAMLLPQACERAKRMGGLSLMPWEGERSTSLRAVLGDWAPKELKRVRKQMGAQSSSTPPASSRPFSINLFIGPEGGFTPEEVELARRYGIIPVTLGPRILRAETAGLVAAAAILYELGDLE